MEVILKQDVEHVGYANDVVKVKDGHARNFLLPRGLAVVATASEKKQLAETMKQRAHKESKIKENAEAISRASYPAVQYTHQGWLTEDQRHFLLNDELDELYGETGKTRTLIWDVADLDDPVLVGEFLGPTAASDHNHYIRGNRMYASNYQFGLRVIDVSNPVAPVQLGYFDTAPDETDTPGFGGSWSNYPFFESGIVLATSGQQGLFVFRIP